MSLRSTLIEPIALWLHRSHWRLPILKRILRFDNFLRRWISFFSFEEGLHPKHRLTQYHRFFVEHVAPTDHVLDIGCGGGHVAADVAKKAKRVVGIDIDGHYLKPTQRYANQENLTFIKGDATTHQFDERFDVIILSNVLEHINDRISLLQKVRHLAPTFLIRVPMIDRDWIVLLKQELNVEHRLDPTHTIEYTEEIFRQELARAGLTITQLDVRFGELYCVANAR